VKVLKGFPAIGEEMLVTESKVRIG